MGRIEKSNKSKKSILSSPLSVCCAESNGSMGGNKKSERYNPFDIFSLMQIRLLYHLPFPHWVVAGALRLVSAEKTFYFHLTWSQFTLNRLSVSTAQSVKRNDISRNNDGGFALGRPLCYFVELIEVLWFKESDKVTDFEINRLGESRPLQTRWNLDEFRSWHQFQEVVFLSLILDFLFFLFFVVCVQLEIKTQWQDPDFAGLTSAFHRKKSNHILANDSFKLITTCWI